MSSFKEKAVMAGDIALMLLRMSKLIINPKDVSPIFKGRTFRNHKSFRLALASLHADPDCHALIESRYLNPTPMDLDALATLPEGTLGQVFAAHMRHYKLDVVFYPPLEDQEDDEISYVRKRARETHDIHHVVLGFPATEPGEMMISAFYLAQNRIPLSALLLGFGFLYTILREPERIDELVECLMTGWQMGKTATRKVLGVKWEEYWETPIDEVRRMIGVTVESAPLPEPQVA
ncbi:Coenzyme Q (ubiquinone) biosynthesis protein Coq4 [compost metagenome]